jgi:hypothetical protein
MMVLFLFASCTKEGPQGPAGADGTNGIDGVDGTDGTNGENGNGTCVDCHTGNEDMMLKSMQWENSGHAMGTSWDYAGTRTGCAECHSSQAFQQWAKGETPEGQTMPLPANCYTCHKIHETHTTADWTLRVTEGVDFIQGGGVYESANANANTCVQCHQSRPGGDDIDVASTDDYLITNKRFGPHHGPQGNMLAGVGKSGAIELGSTNYENSAHASLDCISCHMAEGDLHMGGHTNTLSMGEYGVDKEFNTAGCATCHQGKIDSGFEAWMTEKHTANSALLQQLHDALFALNHIDASGYVLGDDGNSASDTNPRTVSHKHAAAIYNYKFVKEDLSMMIHNPKYAKALINEALNALN